MYMYMHVHACDDFRWTAYFVYYIFVVFVSSLILLSLLCDLALEVFVVAC